jgi:hypothetical protein
LASSPQTEQLFVRHQKRIVVVHSRLGSRGGRLVLKVSFLYFKT